MRPGKIVINPNLTLDIEPVRELCRRYRVHELALFGSAVREDFSATRDVDVLVEFEPDAEVGFNTW